MATLPSTTGFYKALVEMLDLVCDCRYCFSVTHEPDGFTYCSTCGRYIPTMDEA